jgi:DNA topoisomerase-1
LAACATTTSTAPATTADNDEFDIKATVLAAYNVISGPAGRRDWNRFKDLFAPGGQVIHMMADGSFKTMTPDSVTLEEALMLLSLPRVVGQDAEGKDIVASPGRFGPYIKRGEDTRSLKEESQLLTITLEEALELLAQPKRGRGRQAAEPLAELGPNPDNGATIKLLAGRYGPYVTDGTTNASLPKDADPTALTPAQAIDLLRARAAAGPPKKAPRKAGGAKKAAKTTKAARATKKKS